MPTFSTYQADVVQVAMDDDGMRIDALEEALDRLAAEGRTPKFIYTVPSFQNPAGVTMALDRRRRLVRIAAERELLVLEDNPYGLLRYEGEAQPTLYGLDGGEYVIYLGHVLEDPLARACGSAGRPRRRPCCRSSTSASRPPTCAPPRSPSTSWPRSSPSATGARYLARQRALYHRRRDVMLEALAEHFPAEATLDAARRAGSSCGPRSPTTSTRRTCWPARCATTWPSCPAARRTSTAAAASEMRLNFSGVGEDDIREGVRRIGKVVREQVGLYSTLTGGGAGAGARRAGPAGRTRARGSCPLVRRRAAGER